jgi:multidrug efflux pump subunit AcrA (membrane-fusion protein)
MSASEPPFAVQQAQRRLRELLVELRRAAEREPSADAFYAFWTVRLSEAMAADAGRSWTLDDDGEWRFRHAAGPADTPLADDADVKQRLTQGLQEVRASRAPAVKTAPRHNGAAGPPLTEIYFPLFAAGELRGAAAFSLTVESEAARHGCLKFLHDAAEAVERFHLVSERREALRKAGEVEDERRLAVTSHAALDVDAASFALANEGRLLIGCDRLAVLVRRGRKYELRAVSGQDDVNRRAGAVRSLEDVTRRAAAAGETIVFPGGESELDDALTQAFEAYVDESHVKRLVIRPLIPPPKESTDAATPPPRQEPIGALVVEYFGENPPKVDEMRRLESAARCATAALGNAREHESIFLLPVWRTLGRWYKAALEPGSRRRTALVALGVVAALAALAAVPTDFTAYCRGTMNPAELRRVFAPLDGTVSRVAVRHGQPVKKGDALLELRNTDLDIAQAEVEGRRTAAAEQISAVERTLFDEAKKLTAEERARLSGERSRLREEIASLDRQLALYAEKRKQLIVVSPIDGEVTTWSADDLLENRPVRQGQQLLTVAAVGGPWELELRVPDDRSGRVVDAAARATEPLRVTFSPAVDPGVVREGTVVEIQNSAELRGEDGNTVLIRAAINAADLPQRRPGAEAAAHVHCGRRSIGYVWFHDVADFVRSRILFRWF